MHTSLASRTILIFVLLAPFFVYANTSSTQITGDLLTQVEEVTSQENCFSGGFETYQKWSELVENKNKDRSNFSIAAFQKSRPQSQFDNYKNAIECKFFIYKVDGLNIGGFYLAPKIHEGKLPVIVFNRGGTATFGNVTFGLTYDLLMPLAKQGFLIIGSQYRGGLGEAISNGGKDEWGGADVRDVVALFTILEKTSRADMNRIGMLGGSRGGMMTFLALQKGVPVKAIALAAPSLDMVSDLSWRPRMDSVYSKHIPNYDENREEVLAKRSAINWVNELDENVPILLIHGQYDENVNPVSTLRFAMELQKNFHPYKLVILDRETHYFSRNYQEVIDLYIDWFKDYL